MIAEIIARIRKLPTRDPCEADYSIKYDEIINQVFMEDLGRLPTEDELFNMDLDVKLYLRKERRKKYSSYDGAMPLKASRDRFSSYPGSRGRRINRIEAGGD